MTNVNVRAVILDILLEVFEKGRLSHLAIRDKLSDYAGLSKQERAFITRAAEGTIERCIELDYILNQYSKVKVKKMKPVIRNILRMSVYQLKYMDRVPDSAVCNEAVKLTVKRGFGGLKGFVNGVLRSIIREPERCNYEESDSIKYSMPQWMIEMWTEEYGGEKTKQILQGSVREKELCVRWNHSKCDREELLKMLEEDSVKCRQSEITKDIFYLEHVERIEDIKAFQKGFFQVQDMSSAMAGYAAGVKEGDICIDMCAAPGGKTIHLADRMNGTGCVYARDISQQKVNMICENVKRTGFTNIKPEVWDALKEDTSLYEKADVVMADLPCSGLGVLSGKSDIKYRVTPDSIEELVQLQRKILSVAAAYVKPGGTLIYSTCTVNKKENDGNVRWILKHLPFEPESLEEKLPTGLQYETRKDGYVQIFPGDYGMDGFFVAAFRKKTEG